MKNLHIRLILAGCLTFALIKTKYITDVCYFIKESYNNIGTTGAIMPMSNTTANIILNNIIQDIKNNNLNHVKLLEVGSGTGNIAQIIISALEKANINFNIDLVEINPEFINLLNKKFKDNKKVKIINKNIINWDCEDKYNYIVSTLPFNSIDFSANSVRKILEKFQNISDHKGKIFWVEYAILGDIIKTFSKKAYKKSYIKKHKIIDEFKNINHTKREFILLNIPPVYVYSTENLK